MSHVDGILSKTLLAHAQPVTVMILSAIYFPDTYFQMRQSVVSIRNKYKTK